jgi:hypothetical protein
MDDKELSIRADLKNDFKHYAKKCLKIRTKNGAIVPLVLNKAQLYIHEKLEEQKSSTGKVRALILKGRQQGCSTLIGARFYHITTHNYGYQCFILTHSLDATNNLFRMAQRFHEHTPELVKPAVTTNNTKALIFGTLDSGYKIGTAENKNVGRSATIQLAHFSEVAFFNNAADHSTGIMQAIPDVPGTEIIFESTANGIGNYFHQLWQSAQSGASDFLAIFIPWFWQSEYKKEIPEDFKLNHVEEHLQELYCLTNEQIYWRRQKIVDLSVNGRNGEQSFFQEYPCNSQEAFQITGENTFIDPYIVMQARKGQAEKYGPLILGVDPARFGDDRTSIIFRQGRVAFDLKSYTKKDTMEVTGIVHMLIKERHPDRVFIDVGGLGAGIVDRLRELGHDRIVIGINAGGKPLDENKYSNKKAEIWGLLSNWLQDIPVQIPDSDSLHADLCGVRYSFDSNSRLVMEKKEDMKKRGLRSSDEADSLCLTFAMPVTNYMVKEIPTSSIVRELAGDVRTKLNAINRARSPISR